MKRITSQSLKKQLGIGLLQVAMAILILSVGAVYVWRAYEESLAASRTNFALEEVSRWLGHMANIASLNSHIFTGLTAASVLAQTPIENVTNLYGTTITAVGTASEWPLAYTFPDAKSCEYVEARIQNHPGLTTTAPSCNATTNVLTATID